MGMGGGAEVCGLHQEMNTTRTELRGRMINININIKGEKSKDCSLGAHTASMWVLECGRVYGLAKKEGAILERARPTTHAAQKQKSSAESGGGGVWSKKILSKFCAFFVSTMPDLLRQSHLQAVDTETTVVVRDVSSTST